MQPMTQERIAWFAPMDGAEPSFSTATTTPDLDAVRVLSHRGHPNNRQSITAHFEKQTRAASHALEQAEGAHRNGQYHHLRREGTSDAVDPAVAAWTAHETDWFAISATVLNKGLMFYNKT